jgi:GNAT superfamily N-acetyltransferase
LYKLFLDHKTVYYDIEPFCFYILLETDQKQDHLVGYFSKEKEPLDYFTLSCIMTLPPYQRKGYGRLLIEMSYYLAIQEGYVGSPERPISDLGLKGFRSYWKCLLLKEIKEKNGEIMLNALSTRSGVRTEDLVQTLTLLGLIKSWKGENIIRFSFLKEIYLVVSLWKLQKNCWTNIPDWNPCWIP